MSQLTKRLRKGGGIVLASLAVTSMLFSPAVGWADQHRDQGWNQHQDRGRDKGWKQSRDQGRDQGRDNGWRYIRVSDRDHGRGRYQPRQSYKRMPSRHHDVRIDQRHYYIYGGHYYQRAPTGYVVVRPPVGVFVATLPVGFISLQIAGDNYFFAGGVYYRPAPSGYVVVAAPTPAPAVHAPTSQVMVHVGGLNVRSGPGMGFAVVGVVHQGDSLMVYGNSPDWYYVLLPNGQYGWVMGRFTVPVGAMPQG